jgi:glycerophosphoryl diester phosphodiesterase
VAFALFGLLPVLRVLQVPPNPYLANNPYNSHVPLVFAHRGGAKLRPENTILAFDHGLALGADGLEFDVRLSRDGVVVVHHDPTLERTTDGTGPVAARTADELARLDAGFHFGPPSPASVHPFRGLTGGVPRLDEVLRRYRDARCIIELKLNEPELAYRTIDAVRAADAVDRVALGSFGTRVLRAAREYEPRIPTGSSREETRLALYRSWIRCPVRRPAYREFQVPEIAGSTRVVSPRFVRYAHQADLVVRVWTVDDEADMRRLLSWGVDALISDRPDVAVPVVKAQHL